MFGTVARLQVKSGKEREWQELLQRMENRRISGAVASYVYKSDKNPNEYWLSVVFDDRSSYFANANSPEQDTEYRQLRSLLESDPEWHDGEIVQTMSRSSTRM